MATDKSKSELITRREAIFRVSAMFGGVALVGQTAMLAGCAAPATNTVGSAATNNLFRQSDIELLDEVEEDDAWKVIAFVRTLYKGDPAKVAW